MISFILSTLPKVPTATSSLSVLSDDRRIHLFIGLPSEVPSSCTRRRCAVHDEACVTVGNCLRKLCVSGVYLDNGSQCSTCRKYVALLTSRSMPLHFALQPQ